MATTLADDTDTPNQTNPAPLVFVDDRRNVIRVSPAKREAFLEAARAQGRTVRQVALFADDRGRAIPVAPEKREAFLDAARAQGRAVRELTAPAAPTVAAQPTPAAPQGRDDSQSAIRDSREGGGAVHVPDAEMRRLLALTGHDIATTNQPTPAPLAFVDDRRKVFRVSPAKREAFLEAARAQGRTVRQVALFADDRGRAIPVAPEKREAFLDAARAQGRAVRELTAPAAPTVAAQPTPAAPQGRDDSQSAIRDSREGGGAVHVPDAEMRRLLALTGHDVTAIDALARDIDEAAWRRAEAAAPDGAGAPAPATPELRPMGDAPRENPRLADRSLGDRLADAVRDTATVGKRAVVNLAEGAVAIPTLAALGAETGLAKLGALDEGSHPVSALGLRAIGAMEAAKAERLPYTFEQDPARRDASGASRAVAQGGELITEILLANAASKGVAALARRGAGAAGAGVATAAERRALDAALKATEAARPAQGAGEAAARAYAADLSKAYGRALVRENLKEGAAHFARAAARPTYWKASIASRGGIEAYRTVLRNGDSDDKATLYALGDAALNYLILGLGDGAGAFMDGAQTTLATQFVRALGRGGSHPNLYGALAGTALRVFGGAASAGGSTAAHLGILQAAGAEMSDEEKLAATLTSTLFGAVPGALASVRPIRNAILADKRLALLRAGLGPSPAAGEGPAPGTPPPNAPSGAPQASNLPNLQTSAGASAPATPAWAHIARTYPSGDVRFRDGSLWRADSQTFLMPNGAVVDPEGNLLTAAPPEATSSVSRESRIVNRESQEAAAQGDLFGAQPDAPAGAPQASNLPSLQASGGEGGGPATLALYDLLRNADVQVHNVPLGQIQVNRDIKQFKAEADPRTGVVQGEALQGEFQAVPAKPILLLEKLDGGLEVVTGRHRLDLARRNNLPAIPANIIRMKDGWTLDMARALDAYDNILDEKGSDQDFIDFFRRAQIDRPTAEAKGLLARRKGRDAFDVAEYASEDLYALAMGDARMDAPTAAAIAREAPVPHAPVPHAAGQRAQGWNQNIQAAVSRAVLEDGLRADDAAIMARSLRQAYAQRIRERGIEQLDLFGNDDTFILAMTVEAKFAAQQIRQIDFDLRGLKTAAGKQSGNLAARDTLIRKYRLKGPEDREGMARAIAALEEQKRRWQNYHTDPELAELAHAHAKRALRLEALEEEAAAEAAAEVAQGAPSRESRIVNRESPAGQSPAPQPAHGPDAESATLLSPEPEPPDGPALGAYGLTDEQLNGPDFQPLAKKEGLDSIEQHFRETLEAPLENKRFGLRTTVGSGGYASKLATANKKGGETPNAHRYAAKNLPALYAQAEVAVRHADKKLVEQRKANAPHYIRLFAPFVYDGETYVALISQRDADQQTPGVHAIEALRVIKAKDALVFASGPDREPVRSRLANASSESQPDVQSALTEEKIAYTLGDVKLTEPTHLDGTPYAPADLLADVRAAVARFEDRARAIAENRLVPIEGAPGRFAVPALPGATLDVAQGAATLTLPPGHTFPQAVALVTAVRARLSSTTRLTLQGTRSRFLDAYANPPAPQPATRPAETSVAPSGAGDSQSAIHDSRGSGASGLAAYRGSHRAPRRADITGVDDTTVPIRDWAKIVPGDTFTHPERYFGANADVLESARLIARALAGKAKTITVYRAIPAGIPDKRLNDGDWVTPSKAYAQAHGQHALNGNYRIIAQRVAIDDLFWNGDSPAELGYDSGRNPAPDTLANPAPGAPAPQGAQPISQSANPQISQAGAYPMRGEVTPHPANLGGAPGSPAREHARIPLALPDLVLLYKELTEGAVPRVIHNRANMRTALGRYRVGQNAIELAGRIYGLLDASDLAALKERLRARGLFRNEDPAWCLTMPRAAIAREKQISEERLARELRALMTRRVRAMHDDLPAAKVMAHELWHLIDDQDGGLRGRGDLVGHLAALKHAAAQALPEPAFANRPALVAEAKAFIQWWRGVGQDEPYFDKPEEMYAEIGAAYFCAPEDLKARAPQCFAAWDAALARHPAALEAAQRARAYIATGGRDKRLANELAATWGREYQVALRRYRNATEGFDNSAAAWWDRILAALWDDRAPALNLLKRAVRAAKAENKRNAKDDPVAAETLAEADKRLDAMLLHARLNHVLYRRKGPNNARLYLADVKGDFLRALNAISQDQDLARTYVELYATYHRIIELGGRPMPLGQTPASARAGLLNILHDVGPKTYRAIARAWGVFRALYERDVVERPATAELLGPDFVNLMRQNAHYVTFRHAPTPETLAQADRRAHENPLEEAARRLLKTANPASDVAKILKPLKGSHEPIQNPLLETMRTAVALIVAAERNHAVLEWIRSLRELGAPDILERDGAHTTNNPRLGTIDFWENGQRKTLIVPRRVAAGFNDTTPDWLRSITAATRILNAALTTNNPGFVPIAQARDLYSAAYNITGLHRWPLRWIPAAGDAAALLTQFIPPATMRAIGEHPLGRLLLNPNTIEYWTSFGNRMARLIHSGDFRGELERARQDRLAGREAQAQQREYLVQMARSALQDGILLNMVQYRKLTYDASGWKALFDEYHLDFDEPPLDPESPLRKTLLATPRAIRALWNATGTASEIASATTKLAVYAYLNQPFTPPPAATAASAPDSRFAMAVEGSPSGLTHDSRDGRNPSRTLANPEPEPRRRPTPIAGTAITGQAASKELEKKANILFVNKAENVAAFIKANQRRKLVSGDARAKSRTNGFSDSEHLQAAILAGELFQDARLIDDRPGIIREGRDAGNEDPNVRIQRYATDITIQRDSQPIEATAYLTVKVSTSHRPPKKNQNEQTPNRIYSLELLELRDPRLQGKEQTSNHVHPGARETTDNKPYPAPEVKPSADTLANPEPMRLANGPSGLRLAEGAAPQAKDIFGMDPAQINALATLADQADAFPPGTPWEDDALRQLARKAQIARERAKADADPHWYHALPWERRAQAAVAQNRATMGRGTDNIKTPERDALRRRIAERLYNGGSAEKGRKLFVVMGLPGSGKSSAVVKNLKAEVGDLVEVDADEAKTHLPEFQGGKNADMVHAESALIAENYLLRKLCFANGDNVVFPTVGKNAQKLEHLLREAKEAGYAVYLYNVRIPIAESANRALRRYVETGRFVPPDYIVDAVGDKPDRTFATLKDRKDLVDGYADLSNDVPFGARPQTLETSSRPPAGLGQRGLPVGGDPSGRLPPGQTETRANLRGSARGNGLVGDTLANPAPDAPRGSGQAPGADTPIISEAEAKAILESIVWRATVLAGDPTFDIRGTLLTPIELVFGPFINAALKGTFRFVQTLADTLPDARPDGRPRRRTLIGNAAGYGGKIAAALTARLILTALSTGGLVTAAALALFRAATGNPNATEQDLMDSPLGPAVRGAERLGQGYRNISPYLLQNYNTLPLYVDGDITIALTLPIADEERFPILLLDATLNKLGFPWTPNPATGPADAAANLIGAPVNSLRGQGTLIQYIYLLSPFLFNYNPYDNFRGHKILPEAEFAARWDNPAAAATIANRLIESTPLAIAWKPPQPLTPEQQASLDRTPWLGRFHATLTRAPLLSTIAGRLIRVQIGGEADRIRRLRRLDQQQALAIRLLARQNFALTQLGLPPQIPQDLPIEYAKDYFDAWFARQDEHLAARSSAHRRKRLIQDALAIRDPNLRARALHALRHLP